MILYAIIVGLLIYIFYSWVFRVKLPGIPGPFQWPLIGNLAQLDPSKPYVSFTTWAEKYGPVYKVKLGTDDIVVVTGKKELHEALVERGTDIADRPWMYRTWLISHYKDMGFMNYCEEFKTLRKLFMQGLKLHNLVTIQDVTISIVNDLVEDIRGFKGAAFDPHAGISDCILQILAVIVLDEKLEKNGEDLAKLRRLDHLILTSLTPVGAARFLDVFPWLRFFGNKTYKNIQEARGINQELYDKWHNVASEGCWFKRFQKAPDETGNGHIKLDAEHISQTTMELFVAGSATSSSALYGLINILSQNHQVQQKLQKEANDILHGRTATLADKEAMPYSYACVLELMRYIVPLPLGVPHVTSTNTTIGSYNIPKGTIVMFNLWAQHHDPNIWPDPFTFRPERFLTEDGSLVLPGEPPRSYLSTFSAGVRSCPGEVLAISRLFLIIVSLVQNFNILPGNDFEEQPSCHPRDFELGLVLQPTRYVVRMIDRKSNE